ncbi:122_t:CDS:10 [Entrophospora sp. SA101]|nr:122_t:CDS:10 [Entrophospora sp. SA101]
MSKNVDTSRDNQSDRHFNNNNNNYNNNFNNNYNNYNNNQRHRGRGERSFPRSSNAINITKKDLTISKDDNDSTSSENLCMICASRINYYALGVCNHRVCHLCSLRMRALYKTKQCTYCKTEQSKIIITRDSEKNFQDFEENELSYHVEEFEIHCDDLQIYEEVVVLLRYNCPDNDCEEYFESGWHEIKSHVRRGDPDKTGFQGHPECEFCKIGFYGKDELYEHCRDKHEQCHICRAKGIQHQYYLNYNTLEVHFKSVHHLCSDPKCLEKKFVVFPTDIDLKIHEASKHEVRRIETNFLVGDPNLRRTRGRHISRERQSGYDYVLSTDVSTNPLEDFSSYGTNISGARTPSPSTNNNNNQSYDNFFPSLNAAKNLQSNGSTTSRINYSERVKSSGFQNDSTIKKKVNPSKSHSTTKVGNSLSSSHIASTSTSSSPSAKGEMSAFPPLTAYPPLKVNNSSHLNYGEKAKSNYVDSESSSKHVSFNQRVHKHLSHDQKKIQEYNSLSEAYSNSHMTASEFVISLYQLFDNKLDIVGKVVPGFVASLESEEKKTELLTVWNDYKATNTESIQYPSLPKNNQPQVSKSRILVIKSSSKSNSLASRNSIDKIVKSSSNKNNSYKSSTTSPAVSTASSSNVEIQSKSEVDFPGLPPPSKQKSIKTIQSTKKIMTENNAWGGSNAVKSTESNKSIEISLSERQLIMFFIKTYNTIPNNDGEFGKQSSLLKA